MIAFAGMLAPAGMKVPEGDLDEMDYDVEEYPHWHVFCIVQLGASMPSPTSHWDNAKVIAALSDEEIKQVSWDGLIRAGLSIAF